MKVKILAQLKKQFPGVPNNLLDRVASVLEKTVTKEEDIETAVNASAGLVQEFSAFHQSEADRRVTEAVQKREGELNAEILKLKKGADPEPGKTPEGSNPPDIASIIKVAIAEAVKPLQDKLQSFEGDKVHQSRLQVVTDKVKDLPEIQKNKLLKDFKRMNFTDDAAFTEYLTETETDIAAINQENANNGMLNHGRPGSATGKVDGKATEKEVDAIVDQIM